VSATARSSPSYLLPFKQLEKEGFGDSLLQEKAEKETGGRYLTEIEAGRWHKGVRDFEHNSVLPSLVASVLGEKTELRFYVRALPACLICLATCPTQSN
jgi:hypothetical protein